MPDGRVEPHGPVGVVAAGRLAGLATRPQHVTGQVIRAVAENIILMKGWTDGPTLNNGGKRWDADEARPAARHRHLLHAGAGPPLLARSRVTQAGERRRWKAGPRTDAPRVSNGTSAGGGRTGLVCARIEERSLATLLSPSKGMQCTTGPGAFSAPQRPSWP